MVVCELVTVVVGVREVPVVVALDVAEVVGVVEGVVVGVNMDEHCPPAHTQTSSSAHLSWHATPL